MTGHQQIILQVLALVAAFTVKQYIADFVLQTNWMAQGKAKLTGWQVPLLAHAGTHGVLTAAMVMLWVPSLWWMGIVDFVIHVAVDYGKSKMSHLTRWEASDAPYWMLFGFDQLLHHMTGLVLAYFILVS